MGISSCVRLTVLQPNWSLFCPHSSTDGIAYPGDMNPTGNSASVSPICFVINRALWPTPWSAFKGSVREQGRFPHPGPYQGDLKADPLHLLGYVHTAAKEKPLDIQVDFR